MKPTIEIIQAYTDNLSDFTFKELESDKGNQYAFVTGLHHYDIKKHVNNVNVLIHPDVCVITETMEWNDGEDRSEDCFFFEVITSLDIKLATLKALLI